IALQVAAGISNREAAEALFLSPKTIEFHLTRVYRKLDVNSRAELIRLLAHEPSTSDARRAVGANGRTSTGGTP
ncbi:MAG: response regulator transcription factor, partial [Candidatus Limnocylindrales bacterium]